MHLSLKTNSSPCAAQLLARIIRVFGITLMVFTLVGRPLPSSRSVGLSKRHLNKTRLHHSDGLRYYLLQDFHFKPGMVKFTVGSLPATHSLLFYLQAYPKPLAIQRLLKVTHDIYCFQVPWRSIPYIYNSYQASDTYLTI